MPKRELSAKILIALLLLVCIFHVLVLAQVVPYTFVWAGKFNSYAALLPFEILSLALNASFILLVRLRARNRESKAGRIGMWFMFVLFTLNTLGNSQSETPWELYIATPLTLILALLSLRLALPSK